VTSLVLDTTILIDAERADADLDDLVLDEDDVAIAAITVAELQVGVELADDAHRDSRAAFVDDLVANVPVLAYDLVVARAHAALLAATRRSGRRRGAHDLIIAATAAAARRTVVSADPSAFRDLPGVALRSP
jgi:tRNA(fMet)-specific endonuclease VapC